MPRPVFAMHPPQDRIRSRLQRRVNMLRDPRRLRHQIQQVVGKIHRLDRAEPQPLDFGLVEQSPDQIGQPQPGPENRGPIGPD